MLRLDLSHGDPLAGLTQSPCFPLKSRSAAVVLGAMQVNISISIESVLFWRSSVFLGSSVLAQLRSGSSPTCTLDHSPSTALQHVPHNGEHKQNPNPSPFSPVLTCHGIHTGKNPKQRPGSLFGGKGACERVRSRLGRRIFYKQTNKQNPTGNHAIKAELCGKDMPDVYSWPRVKMRPHCSVF